MIVYFVFHYLILYDGSDRTNVWHQMISASNSMVSYITNNKAISYFHPDYASRTEIFIKNGELTFDTEKRNEANLFKILDVNVGEVVTMEYKKINCFAMVRAFV